MGSRSGKKALMGSPVVAPGASEPQREISYRPDIDGLRALAIVGVLLFHVDIVSFSGGYLGVDVFFVISGYLITRIIVTNIDAGRFKLLGFYVRRVRRIIPALICTVTATLIAAGLFQFSDDYAQTAESGAAALLSISNIYFLLHGGYFEGPAQFKPLLHTWSLSVEEQFYLVMPVALILVSGSLVLRRWAIVVGIVASLTLMTAIANFAAFGLSEKTSFFMMPTRAWQLLLGGVSATFPQRLNFGRHTRVILGWIGFTAIVAAFFGANPAARLSGLDAVQPVVGAVLLVNGFAGPTSVIGRVLGLPPVVWLGRISYSVYLVHWPLVSLYKYAFQRELDGATQALLIALSIALGWLQWRFVERPFQLAHGSSNGTPRFWLRFSSVFIATLGLALVISSLNGVPIRFAEPQPVTATTTPDQDGLLCQDQSEGIIFCARETDSDRRVIALIGDSHARMLLDELSRIADDANHNLVAYIEYGCPAALGVNTSGSSTNCAERRDAHVQALLQRADVDGVLLVSRWALFEKGNAWDMRNNWLSDAAAAVQLWPSPKRNGEVLGEGILRLVSALPPEIAVSVIAPIPELDFHAGLRMSANMLFGRSTSLEIDRAVYEKRIEGFERLIGRPSLSNRVRLYRPGEYVCRGNACAVAEDERLYYWDSNHLTQLGVVRIRPLLEQAVFDLTTAHAEN